MQYIASAAKIQRFLQQHHKWQASLWGAATAAETNHYLTKDKKNSCVLIVNEFQQRFVFKQTCSQTCSNMQQMA
jgi:hypothetical protein